MVSIPAALQDTQQLLQASERTTVHLRGREPTAHGRELTAHGIADDGCCVLAFS